MRAIFTAMGEIEGAGTISKRRLSVRPLSPNPCYPSPLSAPPPPPIQLNPNPYFAFILTTPSPFHSPIPIQRLRGAHECISHFGSPLTHRSRRILIVLPEHEDLKRTQEGNSYEDANALSV
jgi:hypothetical protein